MSEFRRLTVPEQVAEHYLAHYAEIGAQSKRELCAMYGVSESTLRSAMAEGVKPRLRAMGQALTVAESETGWRIVPTDSHRTLLRSMVHRLSAMMSELRGYSADELATITGGDRRLFGDLVVAVEMTHEALVAIGGESA